MIIYSIIMFVVAAIILAYAIAIYCGKINLIHEYHQENVVDKVGYGKTFGIGLFVMSIALIASGLIALLTEILILYVLVMIVGLLASISIIIYAQIKYNKGIF